MLALKLYAVPGDLPAIARDASIYDACLTWRWQAGGRRVRDKLIFLFPFIRVSLERRVGTAHQKAECVH